jgi:hypothetical protein
LVTARRGDVIFDSVRAARGVIRSLRIYYGDRRRRGALDRHYAGFAGAGDLVFDIGGHVGTGSPRSAAWARGSSPSSRNRRSPRRRGCSTAAIRP